MDSEEAKKLFRSVREKAQWGERHPSKRTLREIHYEVSQALGVIEIQEREQKGS